MTIGSPTCPQIAIQQIREPVESAPNLWFLRWRVRNTSGETLCLLAVWLPHGQFKTSEGEIGLDRTIPPQEAIEIGLTVACSGSPGAAVENGFLIFRVRWLEELWRVFVRVRVSFGDHGQPTAKTESITCHPVGFSSGEG
jgi:hypothetical protein